MGTPILGLAHLYLLRKSLIGWRSNKSITTPMASIAIASIITFYIISFKINNPIILQKECCSQHSMNLYASFFLYLFYCIRSI